MNVQLLGLATKLPKVMVDQETLAELAAPLAGDGSDASRVIMALYRRSQIQYRGSVLLKDENKDTSSGAFYPPAAYGCEQGPTTSERMRRFAEEAPRFVLPAIFAAMEQASVRPRDITDLITISCTGLASPGLDVSLIKQAGLSPEISRTNVAFMGCHGAFNGLRVAGGIAAANPSARILVCAVELCTLHFVYGSNPQQIVANSLFADGAAAAVIGIPQALRPDRWTVRTHGTCLLPESEDAMTWEIGDHGFAMTLSPRVPELIGQHLRPWVDAWLARNQLTRTQVRSWAIHPGGPRVLRAAAESLELPPAAVADSLDVLVTCGNMSSPTILFILERLRSRGAQGPSVALGFGPGLTIEAMVLDRL